CWFVLVAFMAATYMPKFAEAGVAHPPCCSGVGGHCDTASDCCYHNKADGCPKSYIRCNSHANDADRPGDRGLGDNHCPADSVCIAPHTSFYSPNPA
ncbi:unnamed protein product, partial [Rotaria sordida]